MWSISRAGSTLRGLGLRGVGSALRIPLPSPHLTPVHRAFSTRSPTPPTAAAAAASSFRCGCGQITPVPPLPSPPCPSPPPPSSPSPPPSSSLSAPSAPLFDFITRERKFFVPVPRLFSRSSSTAATSTTEPSSSSLFQQMECTISLRNCAGHAASVTMLCAYLTNDLLTLRVIAICACMLGKRNTLVWCCNWARHSGLILPEGVPRSSFFGF